MPTPTNTHVSTLLPSSEDLKHYRNAFLHLQKNKIEHDSVLCLQVLRERLAAVYPDGDPPVPATAPLPFTVNELNSVTTALSHRLKALKKLTGDQSRKQSEAWQLLREERAEASLGSSSHSRSRSSSRRRHRSPSPSDERSRSRSPRRRRHDSPIPLPAAAGSRSSSSLPSSHSSLPSHAIHRHEKDEKRADSIPASSVHPQQPSKVSMQDFLRSLLPKIVEAQGVLLEPFLVKLLAAQ
jgi:hypothetical protein